MLFRVIDIIYDNILIDERSNKAEGLEVVYIYILISVWIKEMHTPVFRTIY